MANVKLSKNLTSPTFSLLTEQKKNLRNSPVIKKTKNFLDVIDFQYVWGYVLVITCQVSVIANMKLWTKILRLVY